MVIGLPDPPAPSLLPDYTVWVILWFLIEVSVALVLYAISRWAIRQSGSEEWENTPKWARVTLAWLVFLVVYVAVNLLGVTVRLVWSGYIPPLWIYAIVMIVLSFVGLAATLILYAISIKAIGGSSSKEWVATPKWTRVILFCLLFLVFYVVLILVEVSMILFY